MTSQQQNSLYNEMHEWNTRGNDAVREGNSVRADKCYYRAEQIEKILNLQSKNERSQS